MYTQQNAEIQSVHLFSFDRSRQLCAQHSKQNFYTPESVLTVFVSQSLPTEVAIVLIPIIIDIFCLF